MFPKETDSWKTSRSTFSRWSVAITLSGLLLREWPFLQLCSRAEPVNHSSASVSTVNWHWVVLVSSFLLSFKWLFKVNTKAAIPSRRIFWRNPGMLRITSGFLVAWGKSRGSHRTSVISHGFLRETQVFTQLLSSQVLGLPRGLGLGDYLMEQLIAGLH